MARTKKVVELAAIEARREALKAELAALEEQAKDAEIAARDAGRPVLLAALERVKIGAIERYEAKAIATAIAKQGGKVVADHLRALS